MFDSRIVFDDLNPLSRDEQLQRMHDQLDFILRADCPWPGLQHAAAIILCYRIMARFDGTLLREEPEIRRAIAHATG